MAPTSRTVSGPEPIEASSQESNDDISEPASTRSGDRLTTDVRTASEVIDDEDNARIRALLEARRPQPVSRTRMYKVAVVINALSFILFTVSFGVPHWRRVEISTGTGERKRFQEGVWLRCSEEPGRKAFCPHLIVHTDLGSAFQALQVISMLMTGVAILYAVAELPCPTMARYNIFSGIMATLGGLVCVISIVLFGVEHMKLQERRSLHDVTLEWAFVPSLAAGFFFVFAGNLIIYDNARKLDSQSLDNAVNNQTTPSDGLSRFRERHSRTEDLTVSEEELVDMRAAKPGKDAASVGANGNGSDVVANEETVVTRL